MKRIKSKYKKHKFLISRMYRNAVDLTQDEISMLSSEGFKAYFETIPKKEQDEMFADVELEIESEEEEK